MNEAILTTDFLRLKLFKKGKVRDVYEVDNNLLIIATDRISAFDVVMANGIPDKGKILTQISNFWFNFISDIIPNHLISTEIDKISGQLPAAGNKIKMHKMHLEGRTVLAKKAKGVPIECVVRGYLSGSGWKEYQKSGSICGITLSKGLVESDKLPEPIFTPSTKAETGHDENINEEQARRIAGDKIFDTVKNATLAIYKKCSEYALKKGIIIADTKFEFGEVDGKIIIIDEILTPDSSRFWPKDLYKPGGGQPSYDKQFVRDYLETLDWDKTPPGPKLPDDVVQKTRDKYLEALKKLTS